MKKYGVRLLTAVAASSMIVTPVLAAPSEDELKKDKEEKQSEVASLEQQLTDLMKKLGDLEEELIQTGEEITQATEDLKEAEAQEEEQYEAMKKRIKFMYEEGDATVLETLVTAENFSDLVNKAEYVQNVHSYDRKQLEEYVKTKEKVADLKTSLEEDQADLESTQTEYEAKEEELSSTIESKRAEVADLDTQIQAAAEAAAAEALAAQANSNSNHNNSNNGGNNSGTTNGNTGGTNNNTGNTGGNTGGGSSSGNTGGTGNVSVAQAIVNAAYTQLGVPYAWGGTTPYVGLDCSGLTQYCHKVAGISIGRTSEIQGGGGKAVSNPQPGDLVCYGSHIGIYIGNGQMIHAPHSGDVVKISNVYGSPWYRRYW